MKTIVRSRLPSIILLRNENDTKKTPQLDKTYFNLAKKYRTKLLFCKSDIEGEFGKRIIRVTNITQANAEKNSPSSIIFDFYKRFNKLFINGKII